MTESAEKEFMMNDNGTGVLFRGLLRMIVLVLLLSLLLPSKGIAEDTRHEELFKKYADDAVSFFSPISGKIELVEDDRIEIGIGRSDGVRSGMRLSVFREGDEFRHPVTGEALGRVEMEVGAVEVTEVHDTVSIAKRMEGDVLVDDRVRISQGTVPMLFYQTKGVDWVVGDALYRKFKDTERFKIIETELDSDSMDTMLGEAVKKEAVFALLARQTVQDGKELLEVSFYHLDGVRFYEGTTELTAEMLADLKFGYSFLKDIDTVFQLSFEVPSSAKFISSCDVSGDGTNEFVIAINTEIEVFRFDVTLKLLYSAKLARLNEVVWMDCYDIDNNGRAEIVVNSLVEDRIGDEADESGSEIKPRSVLEGRVSAEIFGLTDGKLKREFNTAGFLRVVNGTVYYQAFSAAEGYTGNVYTMMYEDRWKKEGSLQLPTGVNIYDFMPVRIRDDQGYMVIDDSAYINLYNTDGLRIWRSEYKLGGFLTEYEIPGPTVMSDPIIWYIKDRVVPYNGRFIMIKREPVTELDKNLGFSSADIIALTVKGILIEEKSILKDIGGTLIDFTIMDDKIAVLVKPFMGMKLGNIVKGKSPFKRNLHVFSLKE